VPVHSTGRVLARYQVTEGPGSPYLFHVID
jgi:hypothetical protein